MTQTQNDASRTQTPPKDLKAAAEDVKPTQVSAESPSHVGEHISTHESDSVTSPAGGEKLCVVGQVSEDVSSKSVSSEECSTCVEPEGGVSNDQTGESGESNLRESSGVSAMHMAHVKGADDVDVQEEQHREDVEHAHGDGQGQDVSMHELVEVRDTAQSECIVLSEEVGRVDAKIEGDTRQAEQDESESQKDLQQAVNEDA